MKCYNPLTYQKLGFDHILHRVSNKALSDDARERFAQYAPHSDAAVIIEELQRVQEFKDILEYGDAFPNEALPALTSVFAKLTVSGNWLNAEELMRLLGWLRAVKSAHDYFRSHEAQYPRLESLVHPARVRPEWIRVIEAVLDAQGNIKDNASPELASIRSSMSRTAGELRSLLYKELRHANENNWSIEKEITIRNDRLVIPVRADAKGRVPGFVQDVSQSGGTVFIEPAAALPLNNQLRELSYREQNEIIRILQEVTGRLRSEVSELQQFQEIMIQVDMVRAKALLAVELKASLPRIEPEGDVHHLVDACYPILLLKALQAPFEVIPLEILMEYKRRIILISGPNAGGKSVSLKTIGLLQLMLQSGFLVPVDERSVFRIFDSLFLDIGDEQSVEGDLSTYTSHLAQMRQMGDNMNSQSLFLIDEFGTGTDPKLGGAIAEAFLERFVRQRAYGIITTHYGNLKDFAEINKGIINAAMQFDTKGLKPTYRLMDGIPGRSYAFEIATRVGVHETILKKARKKIGQEELDSEQLLRQLEKKNVHLEQLTAENNRKQARLDKLLAENETKYKNAEKHRKDILREAKTEASRLIKDANKRIENTIREIREKQAEKEQTIKLRKELQAAAPRVEPAPPKEKKTEKKQEQAPEILFDETPQAGDWVKLRDNDSTGKLVDIQGKRGVVELGEVRVTVPLKQLYKIKPPKKSKQKVGGYATRVPMSRGRFELEVIGMRVEEALIEVDKLLDDAMLSGLTSFRILHGKGTGALRDAIRQHLRGHKVVTKMNDAPVEQGGSGWTLVELE